jgi:MOSC domain-containing protein YiiM
VVTGSEEISGFGPFGAPPPIPGRLEWIGLRPGYREPPVAVQEARVEAGRGLERDRAFEAPRDKRQVTLVQAEHLPVIAALVGLEAVKPEQLRRNLLVSGINLQALKRSRFRIGGVLFEGTGDCHPCSRMEENLGRGGYLAVRGHGGICARVLEGGVIRVGDALVPDRDGDRATNVGVTRPGAP